MPDNKLLKHMAKYTERNRERKFGSTKSIASEKSKEHTAMYHIFYVVSQSWNPCYLNPGLLHALRFSSYKKQLGDTQTLKNNSFCNMINERSINT